jgi:hypothetical protein
VLQVANLPTSPIIVPADPNVEGQGSGMNGGGSDSVIGICTDEPNPKETDWARIVFGAKANPIGRSSTPQSLVEYEAGVFDSMPVGFAAADTQAAPGEVYATNAAGTGWDLVNKTEDYTTEVGDWLWGAVNPTPDEGFIAFVSTTWPRHPPPVYSSWTLDVTPLNLQAGDLVIIMDTSALNDNHTLTDPGAVLLYNSGDGIPHAQGWYIICDGTETEFATINGNGLRAVTVVCAQFKGYGFGAAGTETWTSSGMPNPPALAGFVADDICVALGHMRSEDLDDVSAQAGFIIIESIGDTEDAGDPFGVVSASSMISYSLSAGGTENPEPFIRGATSNQSYANTIRLTKL